MRAQKYHGHTENGENWEAPIVQTDRLNLWPMIVPSL